MKKRSMEMHPKKCDECDPIKDEECGKKHLCPECHHWHDHAGCHECGCKLCPISLHLHEEHEEHKERHEK